MKRRNTFKLPNALITDERLSPSARKVGAVLYAHRNALGFCKKPLSDLAARSGLCPATVRKAVEELSGAGYISVSRTYRYLPRKGRLVYGRMAYQLRLGFEGGYTLIPRELLAQQGDLTPAAFLVCLCLLAAAGNRRRAFPSIARLCRLAGLAHSTVCRALVQIRSLPWLLVQLCRKRTGAFASNSYHFTTVLAANRTNEAVLEPNLTAQQDTAAPEPRKTSGVLHTLIVKLRTALRKLFSGEGVVPFLAN